MRFLDLMVVNLLCGKSPAMFASSNFDAGAINRRSKGSFFAGTMLRAGGAWGLVGGPTERGNRKTLTRVSRGKLRSTFKLLPVFRYKLKRADRFRRNSAPFSLLIGQQFVLASSTLPEPHFFQGSRLRQNDKITDT